MVDIDKLGQRRAEEYAVTSGRLITVIRDRLRFKGLAQDWIVNPGSRKSPLFYMSFNYETGVAVFSIDRTDSRLEEETEYHFKDGAVRREGHVRNESRHFGVDVYFGEFTQEERDEIVGNNSGDSEEGPREDVFFDPPLPVALEELSLVAQIIDALEVDSKKAIALTRKLPTFPSRYLS